MTKPPEGSVRLVREALGVRRPGRGAIFTLDATAMAEPLPQVPFLVEALGISAGPPTCFAGYGFSRKTLALQDLALSVAIGKSVWGVHAVKKGRSLHLDYEQGDRVTRERYQRLAIGRDINLADVGSALHFAAYPDVYLDNEGGADAYERAVEGFTFVLLDSFRAACPSADENKSDVRKHLDKLARVSERTGAVFVIILHARKPQQQTQKDARESSSSEARYSIRGSGALYDGLSSAFVLVGEKERPTRVHHEKCRNRGTTVEDFGLSTEDVAIGGNPRAGLRVVHLSREQLDEDRRDPDVTLEQNRERILAFFGKRKRPYRGTRETLRGDVKMGKDPFRAALATLVDDKLVVIDGSSFSLTARESA
jgi:hypothetical protein